METYQKGEIIAKGKTKEGYEVIGRPDLIIFKSKDDITAFNDPNYTKQFIGKGEYSTTTSCRVFELLKKSGIPVAYVKQLNEREFVAKKTNMIFLEAIARRLAIGSFVGRYPWMKKNPPLRFHNLITEYFLKTTNGCLKINEEELISGLTTEEDDPFISNPYENIWKLLHPKKISFDPGADLKKEIYADKILQGKTIDEFDEILKKVFLTLEGAFQIFGYRFADLKIEFGITDDGKLVVSDVIDADSWRLLSHDWQSFSKQAFRDGEDLSEIEKKYGKIAEMANLIRIPRQALVIWRGSESDNFDWPPDMPGVEIITIEMSGHKKTNICLKKLEEIMRDYPDGGVIIIKVGRSNGLGPIISAHTNWTVISIPADWKEKPNNIWSTLDMPSSMPMMSSLYDKNAILGALDILAQKNPAIYMMRRYEIEKLDSNY